MATARELRAIMPHLSEEGAAAWAPKLMAACVKYGITGRLREAAFLAQIAHESGELRFVREIWGPTEAQKRYEPPSPKAKELGNVQAGDGYRYRGRGLIQVTGRANYEACGKALGYALVANPELLEQKGLASLSAAWYWDSRRLNALADKGDLDAITRKVNGGTNGAAERKRFYERAMAALA